MDSPIPVSRKRFLLRNHHDSLVRPTCTAPTVIPVTSMLVANKLDLRDFLKKVFTVEGELHNEAAFRTFLSTTSLPRI